MVNYYAEERRRKRINQILNAVIKCGEDGAVKEKIIAIGIVEQGTSRRTMLEYIQALIMAEKIEEKGGLLFSCQNQTIEKELTEEEAEILKTT